MRALRPSFRRFGASSTSRSRRRRNLKSASSARLPPAKKYASWQPQPGTCSAVKCIPHLCYARAPSPVISTPWSRLYFTEQAPEKSQVSIERPFAACKEIRFMAAAAGNVLCRKVYSSSVPCARSVPRHFDALEPALLHGAGAGEISSRHRASVCRLLRNTLHGSRSRERALP